jgi:hypothetical protein
MDADQDILDQLDRQEAGGVTAVAACIAGLTLLAGTVAYFTFQFELAASREVSLDGAMLIAIAAAAMLLVAYRSAR